MFKEQQAYVAMGGAVLLYSLFPLFNALSVGSVTPLVYVFKACMIAVLIDTLLLVGYRAWATDVAPLTLSKVKLHYLASAAFVATIAYVILVYAFSVGSNSGVTMLYELWPIIVFFAFPLIFRDRFFKIGWLEAVAAVIAIVGLALIVAASNKAGTFSLQSIARSGEALGLLAGVLMAGAVLLKSGSIVDRKIGDLKFSDFALIDLINRSFAAAIALIGILLLTPVEIGTTFQWDSSIGFGAIEGLGGLLYWIAIGRSARSSLQLLLYLAPVLAFVWLCLVGLSELTGAILFGAMLIFAANVVAHFKGEQTVAFFMTVVSAIGFGAFAYLTFPTGDGERFLHLGVVITLYSILVGFLLSRLAERNFRQREICLQVLRDLPDQYPEELKADILLYLRDSFRFSVKRLSERHEALASRAKLDKQMRGALTSVLLLRINPISAGEMMATLATGLLTIATAFSGRPEGFLGDLTAFLISVVVTYLSISIIEQKDIRLGEGKIMLSGKGLKSEPDDKAIDFVVAGLLLVTGIVMLVGLALALKHELLGTVFAI